MANTALRIPKDRPVYKLSEPFFDPHDTWHGEGEVIAFSGEPNQGMIPLNDKARDAYDKYMDKLDEGKLEWCNAQTPKVGFVPHGRVYEESEPEIVDVSKEVGGMNVKQEQIRLGTRKRVGEATKVLA